MSENSPKKNIIKKLIIEKIAKSHHMHPRDVRSIIQDTLDTITSRLNSGDKFEFRDFGVFEVVKRKAKTGRNPKNPEIAVPIPARNAVKFTPGKKLKELVEQKPN